MSGTSLRTWVGRGSTVMVFAGGCGGTAPTEVESAGLTGRIAYVISGSQVSGSRDQVRVVDLAAGRDNLLYEAGSSEIIWSVTWAPGGNALVFQKITGLGADEYDSHLMRISAGGGQPSAVFDGPGPEYEATYSSDGRLAYCSWNGIPEPNNPTVGLYIDGTLVFANRDACADAGAPAWEPDPTHLVFCRGVFSFCILYRLDIGTGTATLLFRPTSGELYADPDFSPDGRWLAIERWGGTDDGIWLLDADGTHLTRLTTADDSSPSWSPDGLHLAFSRGVPGPSGGTNMTVGRIHVAEVATGITREILRTNGFVVDLDWIR